MSHVPQLVLIKIFVTYFWNLGARALPHATWAPASSQSHVLHTCLPVRFGP